MNKHIKIELRPRMDDSGDSQLLAATARSLSTISAIRTSNEETQENARVDLVSLKATSRLRRAEINYDGQTANVTPRVDYTGDNSPNTVAILDNVRKPVPPQEERGE